MNLLALLRHRFAAALQGVNIDAADVPGFAEMVLPSQDARFGDYQANCAMPLGKRLGQPPREVAQALVERLDVAGICDPPAIAGPGFINLRLNDDWLSRQLAAASRGIERLGVARTEAQRTFVVDYSSPNVAKPMHVGHIRSTVIGDALYRILGFLGNRVISDNHLGDWGTQFGMIIYGYKHLADDNALGNYPVAELSRLYKLVNSLVEYHDIRNEKLPALRKKLAEIERQQINLRAATPGSDDAKEAKAHAKRLRQSETQLNEIRSEADELQAKIAAIDGDPELSKLAVAHTDIGQQVLQETARLHGGDPVNVELWRRFLPACLADIEVIYKRLGVKFDNTLGESFYQDRLRVW